MNYTVLSPFKDADGIHKPGETVSLSDKDAEELVAIGAVQSDQVAGTVDRQAEIILAIGKLDPENPDLWLKDGRPDTSAIAEITGWLITASERNAAWEAIQAAGVPASAQPGAAQG